MRAFFYLATLTLFFVLLEISFFIQCSGTSLGELKLVSEHFVIPAIVIPGIISFICAQLLIHITFLFLIWAAAELIGNTLRFSSQKTETLGLLLWGISLSTLLLANQYFFPNSKYAMLTGLLFSKSIAGFLLWPGCLIITIAILIALYGLMKTAMRTMILVICFGAIFVGLTFCYIPVVATDGGTSGQPNIILIGVDALRPDFLGYVDTSKKNTPHLDNFLKHSTVFSEALTPIARTFPAWTSILTGQYPKQNGVRSDLADQSNLNLNNTLPAILKKQGYETIFSTDETWFSNIDTPFGFDKIIIPASMGFNDFLLSSLNDFPMSNLLVNTPIGKIVFPHSYANRPAYVTYNPDSFIDFLNAKLPLSRTKPLFLAVHFCLPHAPRLWDKARATGDITQEYQVSLQRVDQQVNDFLMLLSKNKLLEHSIVILLSDHGEAMELSGDRITQSALFIPGKENIKKIIPRFYPPSNDTEKVNQSAGHGTDVLGLTQYYSVLGFRLYGLATNQTISIPTRVSLLDIKPTILSLLGIQHSNQSSGRSLKHFILNKKIPLTSEQHFFTESDFSPQSVRSVYPDTRQVLIEGLGYLELDKKTARLIVKKDMNKLIIASKQFADFYGSWVLALYPQRPGQMTPILVNLKTGQWTNDLQTPFALASPAKNMLRALRNFFGDEIGVVS